MNDDAKSHGQLPGYQRIFGIVLLAGAAGTVFFMAHHPTGTSELTGMAGIVHGVMLIMLLLLATGFSHFAQGLGLQHPLVLLGLVSYLASAAFNAVAAVVNGFVVPAMVNRQDDGIGHDIFDLAWEANQAFAGLAVIATGLAYCLWSTQLIRRRSYWLGISGLVAGLSPLALLWVNGGAMDVGTAMAVYSTQVIWAGLVGIVILRTGARA